MLLNTSQIFWQRKKCTSGWLETDEASVKMPHILDDNGWKNIIEYLNQETSSRNFSNIIQDFRQGILAPIIVYDTEVADGRGRVNFANAMGIPISVVELY